MLVTSDSSAGTQRLAVNSKDLWASKVESLVLDCAVYHTVEKPRENLVVGAAPGMSVPEQEGVVAVGFAVGKSVV